MREGSLVWGHSRDPSKLNKYVIYLLENEPVGTDAASDAATAAEAYGKTSHPMNYFA